MNCATKTQANVNSVLGAIGTAGAVMPNLFRGIFGNGCNYGCGYPIEAATFPACSENTYVTRYEQGLAQSNAAKDSEIALLKADKYTDQKIVETYTILEGKISDLAAEVRANKDAQTAVNMQQAVYNGTNTATINCIQKEITNLTNLFNGVTKVVIPNTSVCPGWGEVTITPATTTSAAA